MRNIWLIGIAMFFVFLGFNGMQFHLSSYLAANGDGQSAFIILMVSYGFFGLGALLSPRIIGIGLKKSMLLAIPTYALMIFAADKGIIFACIAAAIGGIGSAVLWNASISYVIQTSKQDRYGRDSALLFTFHNIGSALGIVLAGFLMSTGSDFLLWLSLAPLLGMAAIWMIAELPAIPSRTDILPVIRQHRIWAKLAIFIGVFFTFSIAASIVPLYLDNPSFTFIYFIVAIAFTYVLGWLSDILGRKILLFFGAASVACGLFMIPILPGIWVIIALVLVSMVNAILLPLGPAIVGDISNKENKGPMSAMLLVVENTGGVLSFLLAALIQPAYMLAIGITMICITAAISLKSLSDTGIPSR